MWGSKNITLPSSESYDAEAMWLHFDELDKELKKKVPTDSDKICHLHIMLRREATLYLYQRQHELPLY